MTLVWPWPILQQGKFGPFCSYMGKGLNCRFPINYWSLWGESCYTLSNKWVHDDLWQPMVKVIHWPLSKVTQIQHFQISFPKTLSRLKPNFIWSLHGMLGWQFIYMFRITWPRWLPSPNMVKKNKNLLLRNQEADDIETWYTASGTEVLPNLFKWWHWVDLDHSFDMIKFVSYCFCMGESLYSIYIVMYFQACVKSAYPIHSGERYRIMGPLVFISLCFVSIHMDWFKFISCFTILIFDPLKS